MKPAPFTLHRPTSTAEAVHLLSTLDNARVIAGGQTLMPMLAMRYAYVDHLVDLNTIAGLNQLAFDGEQLIVGALVRQRELELSPLTAQHAPIVAEALAQVGHVQTRNRGTFVGSVCNLDPASEQPALASLLDATLVAEGPAGSRTIPFDQFAMGFMTTSLASDELVTEIRLRTWQGPHCYAFEEFARRHGDFAIVGAGVMVSTGANGAIDRVAAVLCGVGGVPARLDLRSLVGRQAEEGVVDAASDIARSVDTIEDSIASKSYRQHLAGTLVGRALRRALDRAAESRRA
jgi:aerobic carbon-monoxide dehydrogenase medium subunit